MASPTAELQAEGNALLRDILAALEAQRIEVIQVAVKVEEQRVSLLAATQEVARLVLQTADRSIGPVA